MLVAVCVGVLATGLACRYVQSNAPTSATTKELPPLPGQPAGVFTTARPTFGAAVNDFLNRRPDAQQPIEFPHNTHVGKGVMCEFCHEGVDKGPVAGIPGVRTCMICHSRSRPTSRASSR